MKRQLLAVSHAHAIADTRGLQAALDGKASVAYTVPAGGIMPSDHAAQSHDSPNHEPPYYALAFIMKT